MPDPVLLVTCEHAVNHVPACWATLFAARQELLNSHRGWDPGARELAEELAGAWSAPLFVARITRLLVDHNRSPHHRSLWSEISRDLPAAEKHTLLDNYYRPFRGQVADWIAAQVAAEHRVVHVSVHSFAPVLDGRVRRADLGILYAPRRESEAALGRDWQRLLSGMLPTLKVRRNQPYRGRNDGHQSSYRKAYPEAVYLGLELEINQALLSASGTWPKVRAAIVSSLGKMLQRY